MLFQQLKKVILWKCLLISNGGRTQSGQTSRVFLLYRFGFIEYSSADQAEKGYNNMVGSSVDGRQIVLDFAAERGKIANSGVWRERSLDGEEVNGQPGYRS